MSGFLSRWSQRKLAEKEGLPPPPEPEAAAAAEPPEDAPAAAAAPAPPAEPPDAPEPEPEPEVDLAALPPVESLHAGSDFTVFLKKGVPEGLRQAALRRAWVADPLIRDHVSPLDYAWDFNSAGGLPAGFSHTLGEVGERLEALIRQAVGERPPEEAKPAPEEAGPAEDAEAAPLMAEAPPEAIPMVEGPPEAADAAMDAEPEFQQPRRRHGGALPV